MEGVLRGLSAAVVMYCFFVSMLFNGFQEPELVVIIEVDEFILDLARNVEGRLRFRIGIFVWGGDVVFHSHEWYAGRRRFFQRWLF